MFTPEDTQKGVTKTVNIEGQQYLQVYLNHTVWIEINREFVNVAS